ncbi:hypothetical protein [Williamwhitmania taraxaci]|uniref:Uncharacterized protein n=1 Tax=Williamwhitmania taraxaci TaxID=1640674 RepID=A0A1G6KH35_9BACT|nr:hypothetical protein [Williamwhitmania taraxaci]SDC30227.1 hypothetical protein SAMN05216323_10254 [Williamwhitmania taraxaci]
MSIAQSMKPWAPKRHLLFFAAVVWTFAGGMLLYKGISLLHSGTPLQSVEIGFSILGGVLFYLFLFSKLSMKHAKRIMALKSEKPCAFSFFNIRSYILMATMISSGILLRVFGVIPPHYLLIVYITMGIPLFLSSLRFYYYGIYFRRLVKG